VFLFLLAIFCILCLIYLIILISKLNIMKQKNSIINIIWQLRFYSLVDLFLLIYILQASIYEWIWIILLHISFLFYLEYTHKHSYRILISKYIWIIIWVAWILFFTFEKSFILNIWVIWYILSSMLYVRKNSEPLWFFSPIARWMQNYFLVWAIIWFLNPISFYVFLLFFVRNFAGDLRDITKDTSEWMKTMPIFLGFKNDYKNIHIVTLFMTSFFWWYIWDISVLWLWLIFIVQIITYKITTR